METLVSLIQVVAWIAVAAVAFSVGLSSGSAQIRWLWQRPGLLARSLLAVLVLVPLGAALLVKAVPLPREVATGLLIVAVAIGPVAALKRSSAGGGDKNYALGLNVTLLLVSLVYVPVAVAVLSALFHGRLVLDVGSVAKVILPLQLVPLLVGFLGARLLPRPAAKIAKPAAVVANLLMAVVALVVLVVLIKPILALGIGLLGILALAVFAVAVGHALGGYDEDTRPVLAAFSAFRFPPLALAIASLTPIKQQLVPVVLAYLIMSSAVLWLYSLAGSRRKRLTNPLYV